MNECSVKETSAVNIPKWFQLLSWFMEIFSHLLVTVFPELKFLLVVLFSSLLLVVSNIIVFAVLLFNHFFPCFFYKGIYLIIWFIVNWIVI